MTSEKFVKIVLKNTECAGGEPSEHFHAGLAVDHAVRDGCVFAPEVFFRSRRRVVGFCNIVLSPNVCQLFFPTLKKKIKREIDNESLLRLG
jgi:hypothetical protein